MSKTFQKIGAFYARYRKRGAIVLAIIVAVELTAAAAVAIAGRELIHAASPSAKADGRGTPALGLNPSLSTPSLAVF